MSPSWRRASHHEDPDDMRSEQDEEEHFDSRQYRCCFRLVHIKIGTFVFVTLVFHGIVLGTLYLVSRSELKQENTPARFLLLFIVRLLQFPCVGLLYVGLWLQRHSFLVPFAISQLTLGCFVDVSTMVLLVQDMEQRGLGWPDSARWLNLVLPLFIYALITLGLVLVLYRCFVYFRARTVHEMEQRNARKQRATESTQVESLM